MRSARGAAPRERALAADALRDLDRALRALGVRYYLIGAQAAIVYGSTRVTEDIDVTVHLGSKTPGELVAALARAGFAVRFGVGEAFVQRSRVLPLVHAASRMPVDVVLAGPGLEDLFLSRVRRHRRAGRLIPVVSPEDLVVMKLLAGRPRDLEDLRAVRRALGDRLDAGAVRATLREVEAALGEGDLLPAFEKLSAEVSAEPARAGEKITRRKRPRPR